MSLEMAHEDAQAALAAEALGALEGEEGLALRAHLEGCAECRRELAALLDAAALLALALPERELEPARSGRLRARLLARAAADRPAAVITASAAETARVTPIHHAPSARAGRGGGAGWLAAAAALLLAMGATAWGMGQSRRYQQANGRYAAAQAEEQRLARAVAERDSALDVLGAEGVRVIELASTQRQAPSGRMFWDPRTAHWTFFAHGLPALRRGREYQLWLITPAGPVSAGTFHPGANGHAVVRATFSLAADSLRAVAVTEEPAGGLPSPSGTPLIVGGLSE